MLSQDTLCSHLASAPEHPPRHGLPASPTDCMKAVLSHTSGMSLKLLSPHSTAALTSSGRFLDWTDVLVFYTSKYLHTPASAETASAP